MKIVVDWSQKRQKHILEQMVLRGISMREFHEGLAKGRKRIQRKNVIESIFRYYSIIYEEVQYQDGRKIYPITVKVIA